MHPERKELWTTALRSGDYEQGQEALRVSGREEDGSADAYCCLGVACEVYRKETGEGGWHRDDSGFWMFRSGELDDYGYYDQSWSSLPRKVAEWYGVRRDELTVDFDNDSRNQLTNLNDNEAQSFEQIADLIDEQL
jgi:hypothetical protein